MKNFLSLLALVLVFAVSCNASGLPPEVNTVLNVNTASAPPDVPEGYYSTAPVSVAEPFKIFITSDTHVFWDAMHDDSEAYQTFAGTGDGKMLSYTDPIMHSFVNDILIERPNAVIITGDLTVNGEKTGHEMMAALLKPVTDAGIQVYVIPGNHDINNPFARQILDGEFRYEEYVTPEMFAEIYAGMGYGDASATNPVVYRDAETLSYIAKLTDGLYAVMLDTALYAGNIEQKRSNSGGTVYDETIEWLDECVGEIKAEDPNAHFITAMHHNLFAHHRNFDFGFVVYSAAETRQKFEEWGFNAVFSGHIHVQHIMKQGNITEVVDSSLLVYPVAYGVIEADAEGIKYHTQDVNVPRWAKLYSISDENLLDFVNFSRESFNERAASGMSERLREQGYPSEDTEAAVQTVKLINTYYFAGRIDEYKEEILASRGYKVLEETGMAGGYLSSVFEEGKGEHNKAEISWPK